MASQQTQWMLNLGLGDPSIDEYIQHPFLRQIATFFIGLLFASSTYYLVHSPTSSSIFHYIIGRGSLKHSSASLNSSVTGESDPLALVFLLNLVALTTSATQFASLLAFDSISGQVGCTFVVAWGQLGSQTIRLLGLFKLSFSLHKPGLKRRSTLSRQGDLELGVLGREHDAREGVEHIRPPRIRKIPTTTTAAAGPANASAVEGRRVVRSQLDKSSVASKCERYTIWLALLLLAVVMFLTTAVSTGVLRPIMGLNERLAWCYTRQFLLGNSTMSGMNLLLELYCLIRLLLSIRSRARVDPITAFDEGLHAPLTQFLKRPSILNLQRAFSLLILDAVTIYPSIFSDTSIHVLLQYVPFSAATILVLYTFNQKPGFWLTNLATSEREDGGGSRLSAPISTGGEPSSNTRPKSTVAIVPDHTRTLQYAGRRTEPPAARAREHSGAILPPDMGRQPSTNRQLGVPNVKELGEMGTIGLPRDTLVATGSSGLGGAEFILPSSIRIPTPDFSPFLHMGSSSTSSRSSVSSLHLRDGSVGGRSVGKSLLDPMQDTSSSTNLASLKRRRQRTPRLEVGQVNVDSVLYARQQHLRDERKQLEHEGSDDGMEIMVIDEYPRLPSAPKKATRRTRSTSSSLRRRTYQETSKIADSVAIVDESQSERRRARAQRRAATIYEDPPQLFGRKDDKVEDISRAIMQRSLTWAGPRHVASLGRIAHRDSRLERSGSATGTTSSRMSPGVPLRMSSTDEIASTGTSVREAVVLTARRGRVVGADSQLVRLAEETTVRQSPEERASEAVSSVSIARTPSRSKLQKPASISRSTTVSKSSGSHDQMQQGAPAKPGGLYGLLPGFRFRRPIQNETSERTRNAPSPLPLPPQYDVIDIRRPAAIVPSQVNRNIPAAPRQILPRQVEVATQMQMKASVNQQRAGATGGPLPSASPLSSFPTPTPLGPPRSLAPRGTSKSPLGHVIVEGVDEKPLENVSTISKDDRLQVEHRKSQDSAVLFGSDILIRTKDQIRHLSHTGSSNAASAGHGSEDTTSDEARRAMRTSHSFEIKIRPSSRPSTGASESARPRTLESMHSTVASDRIQSMENNTDGRPISIPGRKFPSTLRISAIGGGRGRSSTWGSTMSGGAEKGGPGTSTLAYLEIPHGSSEIEATSTSVPRRPRSSSEIEEMVTRAPNERGLHTSEANMAHLRADDKPTTSGGRERTSRPASLSSRFRATPLSGIPPLPRRPSAESNKSDLVRPDAGKDSEPQSSP